MTAPEKWRTEIERYRWHVHRDPNRTEGRQFEVKTTVRKPDGWRTSLALHRLIARLESWDLALQVDHRDGQPLHNGLDNLRPATPAENQTNLQSLKRHNTSGVTGVGWHKASGKWAARITVAGKLRHLGLFDSLEAAATARDLAAATHYGEFVVLNRAIEEGLARVPLSQRKQSSGWT